MSRVPAFFTFSRTSAVSSILLKFHILFFNKNKLVICGAVGRLDI